MKEFLYKPAFYGHIISSACILIAVVIFIMNYKKIIKMDALELVKVFGILSIAIAAHAQGHISLEKEYGYDPIKFL
jgi:hypothetical protein